jgi:hypothetical protein
MISPQMIIKRREKQELFLKPKLELLSILPQKFLLETTMKNVMSGVPELSFISYSVDILHFMERATSRS